MQARRAACLTERRRSERDLTSLAEQLAEKNAQLERLNRRLERAVTTDPLTGIGNRRHMMRAIEMVHSEATESGSHYGLLVVDIDHFKRFNDHHGHQVGDRGLVHVTRTVREHLRASDYVFRYGGEELVVLAPTADSRDIARLGRRLCDAVRQTPMVLSGDDTARITVSIGTAYYDPSEAVNWDDVLRRADHALYAAKDRGRDQVVEWRPDADFAADSATG
jgi:diguanylate cyclase (GGDEF)-like protein